MEAAPDGQDTTAPGGWLSEQELATARRSVPITCVDIVLVRHVGTALEFGLIERTTPFGDLRWCHLGGRVRRAETLAAALRRHLEVLVGIDDVVVQADPQPDFVVQWFPDDAAPHDTPLRFGLDPRQHAVALTYRIATSSRPEAAQNSEALRFAWWTHAGALALGDDLWPGTDILLDRAAAPREPPR